jgi:hypothetical protein
MNGPVAGRCRHTKLISWGVCWGKEPRQAKEANWGRIASKGCPGVADGANALDAEPIMRYGGHIIRHAGLLCIG